MQRTFTATRIGSFRGEAVKSAPDWTPSFCRCCLRAYHRHHRLRLKVELWRPFTNDSSFSLRCLRASGSASRLSFNIERRDPTSPRCSPASHKLHWASRVWHATLILFHWSDSPIHDLNASLAHYRLSSLFHTTQINLLSLGNKYRHVSRLTIVLIYDIRVLLIPSLQFYSLLPAQTNILVLSIKIDHLENVLKWIF